MAVNIIVISDPILEGTTPEITATLKNKAGAAILLVDLLTIKLSLYSMADPPTHTIINARSEQDVKNANNVEIDANGNLKWQTVPADMDVLNTALKLEKHHALFVWTYNEGAVVMTGAHIIEMTVQNLIKV